jgi:hypothetical protein
LKAASRSARARIIATQLFDLFESSLSLCTTRCPRCRRDSDANPFRRLLVRSKGPLWNLWWGPPCHEKHRFRQPRTTGGTGTLGASVVGHDRRHCVVETDNVE